MVGAGTPLGAYTPPPVVAIVELFIDSVKCNCAALNFSASDFARILSKYTGNLILSLICGTTKGFFSKCRKATGIVCCM
jgi:ribosomal protein L2